MHAEGKPTGFVDALEFAKQQRVDALFIAASPLTGQFTSLFAEFSIANRIPVSCGITKMADRGCSMAYGQNFTRFIARWMTYVDRILKGAKPGGTADRAAHQVELVITLKNARSIGLKYPDPMLVFAERLIE